MIVATLLGLAGAAGGAELREPCFDRPGRLTPACIVDAGHIAIETAAIDFTHAATATDVTDTIAAANTTLRYGVTQHLEVIAAWTPYVHARTRTFGVPGNAAVGHTEGVGDVTLAVKQSLLNPDGKKLSVALQSFVIVPTAKAALGVGSVVEGVVVPVTLALPADFALGLSPEIDRIANGGGRGHHVSYTMIGGVSRQFGSVNAGVELAGVHNDDPTGRSTKATADLFAAYVPKAHPNIQFDAATYVGLNHDTPDVEIIVGVSKRF
jgi:hypothetical protein